MRLADAFSSLRVFRDLAVSKMAVTVLVTVAVAGCVRWDSSLNIVSAEFIDVRETSFFDDPTYPYAGERLVGLKIRTTTSLEEYGSARDARSGFRIRLCNRKNVLLYGPMHQRAEKENGGIFVYKEAILVARFDELFGDRSYDLRTEQSHLCINAQTFSLPAYRGSNYKLEIPALIQELTGVVEES